jgi:hypothetical protein
VLLSPARPITAFGRKRAKGAVKEKNGRKGEFGGVADVTTGLPDGRTELIDRQKRKGDVAENKTSIAIRGGRILGVRCALLVVVL